MKLVGSSDWTVGVCSSSYDPHELSLGMVSDHSWIVFPWCFHGRSQTNVLKIRNAGTWQCVCNAQVPNLSMPRNQPGFQRKFMVAMTFIDLSHGK